MQAAGIWLLDASTHGVYLSQGQRLFGRVLALANPYFQIESLYRFNAKFLPRWEPRYLLYEGAFGLPRAALATLWAEGQLPRNPFRTSPRRKSRPRLDSCTRN